MCVDRAFCRALFDYIYFSTKLFGQSTWCFPVFCAEGHFGRTIFSTAASNSSGRLSLIRVPPQKQCRLLLCLNECGETSLKDRCCTQIPDAYTQKVVEISSPVSSLYFTCCPREPQRRSCIELLEGWTLLTI